MSVPGSASRDGMGLECASIFTIKMCLNPKKHVKVRFFSQSLLLGYVARTGVIACGQRNTAKDCLPG